MERKYGEGGTGKTTFAATAPKPIIADCENGAKYFGLRGIKVDVAQIQGWSDMGEFLAIAQTDRYDTVIIDPIGSYLGGGVDAHRDNEVRAILSPIATIARKAGFLEAPGLAVVG